MSNPGRMKLKLIAIARGKLRCSARSNMEVLCGVSWPSFNDHDWRGISCTSDTKWTRQEAIQFAHDTGSHVEANKDHEVMNILHNLDEQGIPVDSHTYVKVLQKFRNMRDLAVGKEVHDRIKRSQLETNIYVVNNLIKMYMNCGSVVDARQLFDKFLEKNVFTWTILIGGYVQHGQCARAFEIFKQMLQEGVEPDAITYMSILNGCSSPSALEWGKEIHTHILNVGLESDIRLGNALLNMYAKSRSIDDARQLFDKMMNRNVVSWTVMIGAYAESGQGDKASKLLLQMRNEGFKPDAVTYLCILKPNASPGALEWIKEVHAQALEDELEADVRVGNALVNVYAKCRSVKDARQVFDSMVRRDVVTWNTMVGAYAENGHGDKASELLLQMREEGLKPDAITYLSILKPAANPGALEWVKEVNTQCIKDEVDSDVRVGNALISMYGKCRSIASARELFDSMAKRDVISWSVMIGAHAENGDGDEAFQLFVRMRNAGLKPNAITYLSLLNPCASPGALEWVKEVHAQALKSGLETDVRVSNALITMYAKSGSIQDARQVFDKMNRHDCISWNAMIGGLAQHGHAREALQLFEEMKRKGLRPNNVTFVGVLSACSHAGLVAEGHRRFSSIFQDYGLEPTIEHYGCMVDLLGRAGLLDEAEDVIKNMPLEADGGIWGALLGACRIHGNVRLAELAAEHCLKWEPEKAGVYVLLSNIYAAAGMWDNVVSVRNMMEERGIKKERGCSWIEVDKKVHSFVAEDRSHPQAEDIYAKLESLTKKMEEAGYVPDTQFVMHNMDEQQKEAVLCSHSERLAIAYGLISTPPGTRINIFKNLRVCSDCHTATKFISRIEGREIVARDARRFHLFKDGVCSCGDYW